MIPPSESSAGMDLLSCFQCLGRGVMYCSTHYLCSLLPVLKTFINSQAAGG